MAQGFICNADPVPGIATTFDAGTRVVLGAYTATDAYATAIPAGGYWSHLELVLFKTSGSPASVSAMITWDVDGEQPAWILATAVTLTACPTNGDLLLASIPIDRWPRYPWGAGAGAVQETLSPPNLSLFLAINAGEVSCNVARLQWRDGHSGG